LNDPRDERFHQMAKVVAARLERVRGSLTDEQFERLVVSVARTDDRFAYLDADSLTRLAIELGLTTASETPDVAPIDSRALEQR
jgi:hypothetical protein